MGNGNYGKEGVLLLVMLVIIRKTLESQQFNTIEVYIFFGHILTSRGVEDSAPCGHAGTQAARGSAFFNWLPRPAWAATFSWQTGEIESIRLYKGGGEMAYITSPWSQGQVQLQGAQGNVM